MVDKQRYRRIMTDLVCLSAKNDIDTILIDIDNISIDIDIIS